MRDHRKIYDFLVIGSGFGGSVAALRLAEKGYSVLVIEQGKHWKTKDFPKTNWNIFKYLWIPALRCFGIQKLKLSRKLNILSGTGVGGGSLVYANTLRIPSSAYFNNESWGQFKDWQNTLQPHYATASAMLGRTKYPVENKEDSILREVAKDLGREHTFENVHIGVYLGDKEQEIDPYFGGEGPLRKGCIECAGCMAGCRENAKNTLDKNYLWLASKKGAEIWAEQKAVKIHYTKDIYTTVIKSVTKLFRTYTSVQSRGIILAAGTLGTVELLLKQKFKYNSLPNISATLGTQVRTNSETLNAITLTPEKINNGVAISSSFAPDEETSIEVVKYPDRSGAMKIFFSLAVRPGSDPLHISRIIRLFLTLVSHPRLFIRSLFNFRWARNTVILLVMQSRDNAMQFLWKNNLIGGRMKLSNQGGKKVPAYIETGQEVMERFARKVNGVPQNIILEVLFNTPTTAHILGGVPMGKTSLQGVINDRFEVHHYPGMYIVDGSAIQGNLGVNPSLSILANAEYAMSLIPEKNHTS